jgi:hypothetical protein
VRKLLRLSDGEYKRELAKSSVKYDLDCGQQYCVTAYVLEMNQTYLL